MSNLIPPLKKYGVLSLLLNGFFTTSRNLAINYVGHHQERMGAVFCRLDGIYHHRSIPACFRDALVFLSG
jgi:hypothetical protein